ncbi:MAG: 2-hydroxyacyl-CoA dehydratase family protein, partial [Pseudomonadota bacterium]|nr:2-hydroxyacyl-CoA dehydratase family protein [Pseudomonadota bacterium]
WRKDRATPQADRWLETAFPGWARSILEDWFAGTFDRFERVIFTRGDDAAQRLYYYVCELQRRGVLGGPKACIFDVALIRRATSVMHCERALRTLMRELDIDTAALRNGIACANRQRAWLSRLDSARLAAECNAPGHVYENIARAALFRDLSLMGGSIVLPPLVSSASASASSSSSAARRLLLAGSVPPDDMFHRAAESCDWNVVHEAHQLNLCRHGPPLRDTGHDPVTLLAQHCNEQACGSRSFDDRAAALVDACKRAAADAVVLWLTDEDEALAWHVARQRAALADTGLPHLVMTRRRWDGSDGAADELCHFLHTLPEPAQESTSE